MDLYIFLGLCWGLFCIIKQNEIFPDSSMIKYIIAFMLNAIVFPISIIIAIFNYGFKKS